MLSLRLAGNFKPKGITMFYFNPETIAHFKDLAKQHGVDSEQYKTEARNFIALDYELNEGETVDAALYSLNRYAQGHTCHDWNKSHKRITENAACIYGTALGDPDYTDETLVAVHTFEPVGVIAECVRDGRTVYETVCHNDDICDYDLDGVIDYLWNEFVKHEL